MSPYMLLTMTINEQLLIFSKILMPLRQKKLLKVFITQKTQDLKKLYGGGSFTA